MTQSTHTPGQPNENQRIAASIVDDFVGPLSKTRHTAPYRMLEALIRDALDEIAAERDRLRAVNKELVEALTEAEDQIQRDGECLVEDAADLSHRRECLAIIIDAIAKAEGSGK